MKRKNKIILALIVLLIIGGLIYVGLIFILRGGEKDILVLDTIDKYGYTLEDRDTELFNDYYENLKSILTKDSINYESYAKNLAALYIIDLYTISNKVSKYDVGGSDYVKLDFRENHDLKVIDTMYKYIAEEEKSNLPEVSEISKLEVTESEYLLGELTYKSYEVNMTWSYVKNLGYDTAGVVTIILEEDRLDVIEFSTGEES